MKDDRLLSALREEARREQAEFEAFLDTDEARAQLAVPDEVLARAEANATAQLAPPAKVVRPARWLPVAATLAVAAAVLLFFLLSTAAAGPPQAGDRARSRATSRALATDRKRSTDWQSRQALCRRPIRF
jgi:hypothetical protein